MIKYLCGFNKVDSYRSTFINLAEPILVYSDPIESPYIDVAGIKMNSWTKFEYNNNSTLDEFKTYYEKIFNTTISMIVIGTNMIYADFLGSDSLKKPLLQIIHEVLKIDINKQIPSIVTCNVLCDDENKILPSININLKDSKNNMSIENTINY